MTLEERISAAISGNSAQNSASVRAGSEPEEAATRWMTSMEVAREEGLLANQLKLGRPTPDLPEDRKWT